MRRVSLIILLGAAALAMFARVPLGAQTTPRLNPMIERLERGEPTFGSVDWEWIDLEDNPFVFERLETALVRLGERKANGQLQRAPLVRIPQEGDEDFRWAVKQVLDLGAFGIVFPHIESKEQATKAIESMRYPPQRGMPFQPPRGRRAWEPVKAAKYWGLTMPEYLVRADVWPLNPRGELFATMMIESAEGVAHIDEILAVPGVGAAFVGPNDLGVSLGVGAALPNNAPDTEAAVQTVLKACLAHHVICGYPGSVGGINTKERVRQGFKVITGPPPQ